MQSPRPRRSVFPVTEQYPRYLTTAFQIRLIEVMNKQTVQDYHRKSTVELKKVAGSTGVIKLDVLIYSLF